MEKLQGKYIKIAPGVARNTPDYIWKLEAGRRSIEIEVRRRAGDYIIQILKMKEGRRPQICLREEVREIPRSSTRPWEILNKNSSNWGAEFMKAMTEVGDDRLIDLIWAQNEETELIDKVLKVKVEVRKEQHRRKSTGRTKRSGGT